jgi:peptidylprolyl isomerase
MAIKKRDRIFAAVMAGVFLLTSSAVAITVIYTMIEDNKKNSKAKEAQVEQQQNQLQGKPLAGFTPVQDIPELKVEDTSPGNGDTVKPGDTVTVDYTGAVAATGTVFQSSKDTGQPVSFPLNQVIAGWSQGIPGMKEGGTRRLLIPSNLAYGPNPPAGSNIPANADLVFDVTMHKVGK